LPVTTTGLAPARGRAVVPRDDYSSVVTFEKVLRGFERMRPTPGDLTLYNRANEWAIGPGRFTVWIGASSHDVKREDFFEITDGNAPSEAVAKATNRTGPR
jgi:beta-glucosidase